MSTTREVQISATNVLAVSEQINHAIRAGRDVTVNGLPVARTEGRDSALAYQNGTLAYLTPAKAEGKTRQVFVKVGHMATITSEAPEDQGPAPHATIKPPKGKRRAVTFTPDGEAPAPAPRPTRSTGDRITIPASVKGETGYLSVRTVNGKYAYAVTMDENTATLFRPGGSAERHMARAEKAGIKIPVHA